MAPTHDERPIRVTADYRERSGALLPALRARDDVLVMLADLKAGDYILEGRVTVERKTCPDLVQALRTGRLFRQAAKLKRHAERPVLLVEGVALRNVSARVDPTIRGAIASLSVMWYLPVLWAAGPTEAADLLVMIGRQWNRDRRETWAPPPRAVRRSHDLRLNLLRCLPGVGPKLARELLDAFGSVQGICAASPSALSAVKGIGKRRVESIRRVLL